MTELFVSLHEWYTKYGRHALPWRDYHHDIKTLTYRVWLAEILLQQTQAERVIGYYLRILAKFPTIESLATATYEEFYPYYQGLGYYSRARRMLVTAQEVCEKFDGIFPREESELLSLKGIGPYTACAIRAFAYDESVLAWDANLETVFRRIINWSRYLPINEQQKWAIESAFTASRFSGRDSNNALMDLGAAFRNYVFPHQSKSSLPTVPYPFIASCKWWKTQGMLEIKPKITKKYFPKKDATVIAILHENHKKYFSREPIFTPFEIWAIDWKDSRKLTQDFFVESYQLSVSVRPPNALYYSEKWEPQMQVYVQIQSGVHTFFECSRTEFLAWQCTQFEH